MFCCRALPIVLAATLVSACASSAVVARPSAFPTAPAPVPAHLAEASRAAAPMSFGLIQTALGFRGIPYRLGGDSPSRGFDCSGFVQYVFGLNHIQLPRTVLEQSVLGHRINPRELGPADLLFFATGVHGVSHVGIAIGGGRFVHAPGDKGVVRVDLADSPYWKGHFLEARRVVPGA